MIRRAWHAPEVVQTSAMDCGPATLTCVLQGHGLPVHYGRLREACQTDVDGTSINALEDVAQRMGLQAEQVLLPLEHVASAQAQALPAIAVLRLSDGAAHFAVLWRRIGPWLQVMDPASGRRWVPVGAVASQLYAHTQAVAEADWREWAGSEEAVAPLRERLSHLGASAAQMEAWLTQANADATWFTLAALDACTRMASAVQAAGAVARGREATALLDTALHHTLRHTEDIFEMVGQAHWQVVPDPDATTVPQLLVRGVVLLKLRGRLSLAPIANPSHSETLAASSTSLEQPLAPAPAPQAWSQSQPRPWQAMWALLAQSGSAAPWCLALATALAGGTMMAEALLWRSALELASQLHLPMQRVLAVAALLAFCALLLALEWPIAKESLRLGRHLELRLRMALLAKLPQLQDRYFHSRAVSDMAERSHALQALRLLPSVALHLLQTSLELLLTLCALVWLAPGSAMWAVALGAAAVMLPWVFQPWLNEADARTRNHASALSGVLLDAMRGATPVRVHRAQQAMHSLHEALLVNWSRASMALARQRLAAGSAQHLVCTALACACIASHFLQQRDVAGTDLLFIYWALKLPAIGANFAGLLREVPAQRNIVLRLLEPLSAPTAITASGASSTAAPERLAAPGKGAVEPARGVAIHIQQGQVLAGGHVVLRDLNLAVQSGEHVALVGTSGAGKSSLLGLLLGWHTLHAGQLRVDGDVLDTAALQALRRHTAWVDPSVQLWNRSLWDNLHYASGAGTGAAGQAALQAAQLLELLPKLPRGLQTVLGEGGGLLSGGEGQRLRLARAWLQPDVRLALLDEPWRGLGRGQRQALTQAARAHWHAATLLCVTHDVQDTLSFPRVWVVEDGRVVEDGVPAQLATQSTRYAALLQAEQHAREALWQHPRWRQLRLEGGRLT